MRKAVARMTSLVAIVLLLTAASYSQFMQQVVLKADVPFAFSIGTKNFPAGAYVVVRVTPHTLTLRNADNRVLATFVTAPVFSTTSHSGPALRFESVGNRHVLTQVWPSGVATGYELTTRRRAVSLALQQPAGTGVQAAAATTLGK